MLPVSPDKMPGARKLNGVTEYEAALDELLASAVHTLRIFDRTLSRRFNTPERAALLAEFLRAKRTNRAMIVLHDASNTVRDCPRIIQLLRRFSHNLAIHQTLQAARHVYDPFAVADDMRIVRRFHYNSVNGEAVTADVAMTGLLTKRFDEIWQASAPAVTATTIGL